MFERHPRSSHAADNTPDSPDSSIPTGRGWAEFKRLYKTAETNNDNDALAVLISDIDVASFSRFRVEPPSDETLAYMKRRARRYMRGLANADPDEYVRLSAGVLRRANQGIAAVDLGSQWVTADILYGGGTRVIQSRHGRGKYVALWSHVRADAREERVYQAWDRHIDKFLSLWISADMPWQVREMAVKGLQASGVALPPLAPPALSALFRSPSPILIRTARSQVQTLIDNGGLIEPTLMAEALFWSDGRTLPGFSRYITTANLDNRWKASFAYRLTELLTLRASEVASSRRVFVSARTLVDHFSQFIPSPVVARSAKPLLESQREELDSFVKAAAARSNPDLLPEWFVALDTVSPSLREQVIPRLVESARGEVLDLDLARTLALSGSGWSRKVGWQVLREGMVSDDTVSQVWDELLEIEFGESPALRSALESPPALELLGQSGMSGAKLTQRFSDRPFLIRLMSPAALSILVGWLEPAAGVDLIARLDEAQWISLRSALPEVLRDTKRTTEFWRSVWPFIASDEATRLREGLLQEVGLRESLLAVDGTFILESDDPDLESLMIEWLSRHIDDFPPNSTELFLVSTNKIPGVRRWGLGRALDVGINMPFGLRLLESGLPEAMAVGRSYMVSIPAGSQEELTAALAMCDSADRSVQTYGREYLRERWASLPHAEGVLTRLAEHPDPLMQEFVLTSAQQATVSLPEGFRDRVLRDRDRGRKAKEIIKAQLEEEHEIDVNTYLELARSVTKRDAEWALMQLTQMALRGQHIDALSVERDIGD